jgi:hypothetical protein
MKSVPDIQCQASTIVFDNTVSVLGWARLRLLQMIGCLHLQGKMTVHLCAASIYSSRHQAYLNPGDITLAELCGRSVSLLFFRVLFEKNYPVN